MLAELASDVVELARRGVVCDDDDGRVGGDAEFNVNEGRDDVEEGLDNVDNDVVDDNKVVVDSTVVIGCAK